MTATRVRSRHAARTRADRPATAYRCERGTGSAQWPVWSTTARLLVTDPYALGEARIIVERELDDVAAACSRFDATAEIHRVEAAQGSPVAISSGLAELLDVALRAAAFTDGDVDPTLGSALAALGYDRDLAEVIWSGTSIQIERLPSTRAWEQIELTGQVVRLPPGAHLDLGATAKAHAADSCAALVAERLGVGVLISLGGDIATAGTSPDGGWLVRVRDQPTDPSCTVALPAGAALATSSTASRTWRRGGRDLHHILDPRTARPAEIVWRTASAVAASCVQANTLTTASLVRGWAAVPWLRDLGAPARLVGAVDGGPRVLTLGSWPVPAQSAA